MAKSPKTPWGIVHHIFHNRRAMEDYADEQFQQGHYLLKQAKEEGDKERERTLKNISDMFFRHGKLVKQIVNAAVALLGDKQGHA